MKTFHKVTTVDTNNLQSGELIHMYFALYNVTYIHGLTTMPTIVCVKTIILWVFNTAFKKALLLIICFIITKLKMNNTNANV